MRILLVLGLVMLIWGCGVEAPMAPEEPAEVAVADSDTTFVKSRFQSRYSTGDGGPVSRP